MALLNVAKQKLADEFDPASFNIGINDGVAAGRTIPHLHIHLIPRYIGDVPYLRGGILWLIPCMADYWSGW